MTTLQTLEMALAFVEHNTYGGDDVNQLMDALRQQIALEKQQSDEPVAYSVTWDDVHCGNFFFREQDAKEHKDRLDTKYPSEHRKIVPLYTRPQPAREWVGLTMEDKQEYVAQDYGGNRLDAMDWAEKRLKEKNT